MNLSHAILHVFDFGSGDGVLSARELDLTVRQTRSFVQRHLRKVRNSPDGRAGGFAPDSPLVPELAAYLRGERDFAGLSCELARSLAEQLRLADPAEACDLLVVDFEDDVELSGARSGDEGGDDAPDAFEGRAERVLALLVLPRKTAFAHDLRTEDAGTYAELARLDALLPSPAQKLDSWCLINLRTMAVEFADRPRSVAGESVMVIPDRLLRCSSQASTREVIDAVTRIVADVATECGGQAAQAVSKAKARVAVSAGEGDVLLPWDVGDEVFEDEPQMRRRYREEVEREDLPEQVSVKRAAATRMASRHRIRTDTGIELTFPAEFGEDPAFMQFIREPDGHIVIELRNILEIENR